MGRSDGKRSLGRPRYRWEDNIKTYTQEVSWGAMDWICLAHNRTMWCADVDAVMNFWVP